MKDRGGGKDEFDTLDIVCWTQQWATEEEKLESALCRPFSTSESTPVNTVLHRHLMFTLSTELCHEQVERVQSDTSNRVDWTCSNLRDEGIKPLSAILQIGNEDRAFQRILYRVYIILVISYLVYFTSKWNRTIKEKIEEESLTHSSNENITITAKAEQKVVYLNSVAPLVVYSIVYMIT